MVDGGWGVLSDPNITCIGYLLGFRAGGLTVRRLTMTRGIYAYTRHSEEYRYTERSLRCTPLHTEHAGGTNEASASRFDAATTFTPYGIMIMRADR